MAKSSPRRGVDSKKLQGHCISFVKRQKCKKMTNCKYLHSDDPPKFLCPNFSSAPTSLKFINVRIGEYVYPAMLDSGCSRTCIRSDLPFIEDSIKSDIKLTCANQETVSTRLTKNPIHMTAISDTGTLSISTTPLITDRLSVPIIIGLDVLHDITISKSSAFVELNGHRIQTVAPQLSCNSLRIAAIIEKVEEEESLRNFQSRRLKLAETSKFSPKIGSFGDATESQRSSLQHLVDKFRLAFTMGDSDLGQLFHYRFSLPFHDETQTTHQPPRPIPIHIRDQVANEIKTWQDLGIISETQSSNNIPLIILRKPDKSIRISLDARGLNQLLVKDRFPLPHMTTVFSRIGNKLAAGESCFISSLDLSRAYWQVRVAEEDAFKLAFSHNGRHYQANRMLYGTATAPSAFSRIMAKIMTHPSIIIYLDDLICIDSCFSEHLKTLEFIFRTCYDHGLLLSAKKCNLCMRETDFLGHKISSDGISPTSKHLKAVEDFQPPTDRNELKRYLGMVNYNIKFIKSGSAILAPLYELTSHKVDFKWTDRQQSAFEKIKQKLLKQPTLAHFQLETVFMFHVEDQQSNGNIFSFENRVYNAAEFSSLQNQCDTCKNLIAKTKLLKKSSFKFVNDVLYNGVCLVLPSSLADEFINYLHLITGHAGSKQILHMLRKFYISNVQERVRAITSSCATCIRIKPSKQLKPSMIQNRHFESVPFEKSFIDLVDYGRPDSTGKRYLLTCCDSLTGYLDGEPISSKSDKLVARSLLKIILRHGMSGVCVSDNGREFGPLCKEIFEKFEIRHVTTTAYRSRSNGKLERLHREIHIHLKNMNANDRNWSLFWPEACYYINNLPKATLDGLSANEALFGRSFHLPYFQADNNDRHKEPFITSLSKYLKELHPSLLAFQIERYQKQLKKDTNNCPILEIGTRVLAWKPDILSGKLGCNWSGPYKVYRRISKNSYIVKCEKTNREYRRHISLLRPLKIRTDCKTQFITESPTIDDSNLTTDDDSDSTPEIIEPKSTNTSTESEDKEEPMESSLKNLFKEDWSNRLRPRL
ncbi:unnamed protein product [Oikopleura dioica]|uniref:Gypsy retrotransposon integrase-like protein 1 n=1 Tax=Oikopleura dioica TaxID=34765 RepID=E4X8D3_OIKDI|nr:unnamed protein product [Oikopleura dioica]